MVTKGTFMKSHTIDPEIVAMKAEMVQLRPYPRMWNRQALRKRENVPRNNSKRRMRHGRRFLPRKALH